MVPAALCHPPPAPLPNGLLAAYWTRPLCESLDHGTAGLTHCRMAEGKGYVAELAAAGNPLAALTKGPLKGVFKSAATPGNQIKKLTS